MQWRYSFTVMCMQVLSSGYVDYIRPPIDCYRTLQFGSFDEISDVGYSHAHELFTEWSHSGRIHELFTGSGTFLLFPGLRQFV